jgi:hypothetical protein
LPTINCYHPFFTKTPDKVSFNEGFGKVKPTLQ